MMANHNLATAFAVALLLTLAHQMVEGRINQRDERRTPPKFSDQYSVEGLLMLPYAEIEEPFAGYIDLPNYRSRVDYYGDLVKTLQVSNPSANTSVSYKIAWMTTQAGTPQQICVKVEGSWEVPIAPQTVVPDLSQFTYAGQESCPPSYEGSQATCDRYEYTYSVGDKVNRYKFWLTYDEDDNPIPVRYNMEGYDSLLGSHYDKYEVLYKNFQLGPVDEGVFSFVSNMSCGNFPGPGHTNNVAISNPIREFIDPTVHHDHNDRMFNEFKRSHNKTYLDKLAHEYRKHVFRHNYRFIESKNRQNLHYKLKVNHLADWTQDELRALRGRRHSGVTYNGGLEFNADSSPELYAARVPKVWDWRLAGAVTPVKDQAVCGSCWSFGTVGTLEGTYFVKYGHLPVLSEQQLVDCSWTEGNNGCDGGEDFRAYQYIMKAGGLTSDHNYGSYLGQDGKCHDMSVKKMVQISGFYNVTPNDENAMRVAVYNHGPVTVAIDASHQSLSFYSHGVYYEPKCGNKPENLDHQVLVVGYGELYGQKYWLVKNSWSTYWGNDGYVLMSAKDNNCGVMTMPTFPIIA